MTLKTMHTLTSLSCRSRMPLLTGLLSSYCSLNIYIKCKHKQEQYPPLHFQKQETEAPMHRTHLSFPTCPSVLMPALLPACKSARESSEVIMHNFSSNKRNIKRQRIQLKQKKNKIIQRNISN